MSGRLTGPRAAASISPARASGRGGAVRKHLSKVVVVIVAIVFTSWFLLWPDEEEPIALEAPAAESGGADAPQ